jgi:hypothetical protein
MKGWMAKIESKLKQVLCFQDVQKKHMYRQHVKEKEARARQLKMMHHMGLTHEKSGSEKSITLEEKWMENTFQWTDHNQFVLVEDLSADTSRAMESPPHARDVDESSEEAAEEEDEDDYDSE